MKKIFTLFVALFAMTICAKAQIVDGFEDYDAFTVDPAGFWTFYDGDGAQTYGYNSVNFPNTGYTGACIVFNPSQTNPSVEDTQGAHSGSQFLAFFNAMGNPVPTTNDWIISPALSFTSNGTLSLYARELTDQYGAETMKIWVSSTNNEISSFSNIATESIGTTEWTEYTYNIPAGTKYVAINCNSTDVFALFIDDVVISGGTTSVAEVSNNEVSVYPNPANNVVNVNANSNIDNVEIYSISGQKVGDFSANGTTTSINTESLSAGMYLMKINTENGVINKKFSVAR